MPSFRKPSGNRRRNKASYVKNSTGARSQSKQILSNLKSIEYLKTQERGELQRVTLDHQVNNQGLTGTPMVHPIIPATGTSTSTAPVWNSTFWRKSSTAIATPQATCGRIYLNMAFTSYSEKQPLTFSVIHCKMTKAQADYLIKLQTINLNNIAGNTFTMRGATNSNTGQAILLGTAHLNPDYFKTIKRWDFTLGSTTNTSSSATFTTVLGNTHKAIQYSFPTGYKMGQPQSSLYWSALTAESVCKNEHYNYIIVFSDNVSGADFGYPSYTIQASTTVTARI